MRTPLPRISSYRYWTGTWAVASCLMLGACVTEPSPVTGEPQHYGMSWQQELSIGKEADVQIRRQFGVYDDPELEAYVNRVADAVLAESDFNDGDTPARYQGTEFTFRVLDSPVVNAFALPGGYVYVTRGILAHMDNEAQLAVVLGHEIAHVAARHASRQALRTQFSQLGLVAGAILGEELLNQPGAARNIVELGGAGLQLMLLKYGRDAEREADRLGVGYAARQGYAVGEAAGFFRSLGRLSERQHAIPTWQASHPDPGERAETIRALSEELRARTRIEQTRRSEFLRELDGMIVGNDPRQGYEADGRFFHPEMRFQFGIPDGWQLINERSAVALLAPGQKAVAVLTLSDADSPRAAAKTLAGSEGIRVLREGRVREAEFPTRRVVAVAGELVLINDFIADQGRVFSFAGYGPKGTFDEHESAILSTLGSFAALEDPSRLEVEPARLAVSEAPRTAPLGSLVQGDELSGISVADMLLMNQLDQESTVEKGRLIKTLR